MKKIILSAENNYTFEAAVHNGPEGDIDRYMFGSAQEALEWAAEQVEQNEIILDGSAISALLNNILLTPGSDK